MLQIRCNYSRGKHCPKVTHAGRTLEERSFIQTLEIESQTRTQNDGKEVVPTTDFCWLLSSFDTKFCREEAILMVPAVLL